MKSTVVVQHYIIQYRILIWPIHFSFIVKVCGVLYASILYSIGDVNKNHSLIYRLQCLPVIFTIN